MAVSVMFVCLGNICRSPTAHGVFEALVAQAGLSENIQVDSSGTGDWHLGEAPDSRAIQAAAQRGYQLQHLVSRQVIHEDFHQFDYVLAMDRQNLANIKAMCPENFSGQLGLFLQYAENCEFDEVPDPYYGGANGFDQVLDLVEEASRGLLKKIKQQYSI